MFPRSSFTVFEISKFLSCFFKSVGPNILGFFTTDPYHFFLEPPLTRLIKVFLIRLMNKRSTASSAYNIRFYLLYVKIMLIRRKLSFLTGNFVSCAGKFTRLKSRTFYWLSLNVLLSINTIWLNLPYTSIWQATSSVFLLSPAFVQK